MKNLKDNNQGSQGIKQRHCSISTRLTPALAFSIIPILMVMGALDLGTPTFAQSVQNGTIILNSSNMQSQNEIGQQQQQQLQEQSTITKPDAEIIVFAEDLFEIRDNLAEARTALDSGNYVELAQHIENLDQLVTVMLNPLPEGTSAFEQRGQQMQQYQQQQRQSQLDSNITR